MSKLTKAVQQTLGDKFLSIIDGVKVFRSRDYNYNFRLSDGYFQRWGRTFKDDPIYSTFSPEIMDIEISAGESCPMTCPFCYKGNKKGDPEKSDHMSLETFKGIMATLPRINNIPFVCQIAFGITSVGAHPQIFEIFQHCRDNTIIPNVTINGADPLTDEQVATLIKLTGAMAVSVNKFNFENGVDLIKRLTDAGGKQINIHYVISKQTLDFAYQLCDSIKNDPRLSKMNAIVFLGLKPKNRGQVFDILHTDDYIKLVQHCLEIGIRFGFDSCSAPKFDRALEVSDLDDAKKRWLAACSERCESGLFSAYIDCDGKYWQCSFGEGMDISYGIDVTGISSFHDEVWTTEKMGEWRTRLLELNRECPLYSKIHIDEKPPFPHEMKVIQ